MDFFEVATSTPTVRRFLDRPIPEADLMKVLETANMAPSGSNAQPWEFVIVREPDARRKIQSTYEELWGPYKESAIIRGRTTLSARAVKAIKVGDEFAATLAIVGAGWAPGFTGYAPLTPSAALITVFHYRAPYALAISVVLVIAAAGVGLVIGRRSADEHTLDQLLQQRRQREELARRRREDREQGRRRPARNDT